jgi:hypothetical protein
MGSLIVPDEIRVTICASQLEISVVGCQPAVQDLRDGYPTVAKNQRAWRLFAAMTRVTLDIDAERAFFRHPHRHLSIVVLKALSLRERAPVQSCRRTSQDATSPARRARVESAT